jgi:hypothetical protein
MTQGEDMAIYEVSQKNVEAATDVTLRTSDTSLFGMLADLSGGQKKLLGDYEQR